MRFSAGAILVGVLIIASAGVAGQDAERADGQRFAREFAAARAAKDWTKAIEVGLRWTGANPADASAAYFLACAHARNGDKADAFKWLRTARRNGFDRAGDMMRDEDLASLHGDREYEEILATVRMAEKVRFGEAAEPEPLYQLPASYDGDAPLPIILAIHDAGGSAAEIVRVWTETADRVGAVLVAPHAPQWDGAAGFRWRELDETEYVIMTVLEYARERVNIEGQPIVIAGFGQGGYMAMGVGLRHKEIFDGVITVGGTFEPSLFPTEVAKENSQVKAYLIVGENDRGLKLNQAAEKALEILKIPCKLSVFEDVGHDYPADEAAELERAFRFVTAKK